MPSSCPLCHSDRVETRCTGRRVAGAAGAITAAASSGLAAMSRIDPTLPPAFRVATAVTTAVLSGLAFANLGCKVGATLGDAIDKTVLRRFNCLDCGFSFCDPDPQTNHHDGENT